MTTIKNYNARAVGVPWVRKEDYEAFLAICEDADMLPETWEKFAYYTEMGENKFRTQGYLVVRANIDPNTFPDWCKCNGVRVDTQGRQKFAAAVAAETHGGKPN